MNKFQNKFHLCMLAIIPLFIISACSESLEPQDLPQQAGKIVIRGYVQTDSVQITTNNENLEINDRIAFINNISSDYGFVYYDHQPENIEILNHETLEVLRSYQFTEEMPEDTLSFFYKPGIWIDDVLSFEPGELSQPGYTGYRFIFPNLNQYSNSGYNGKLDGILRKVNGQQLGIAENIGTDDMSTFVEFPYGAPPIVIMKLVKHGTTESYLPGQTVEVQMVMQNNESKLIVLEETQNAEGQFSGVDGNIDLAELFF